MALETCKDCGGQLSSRAKQCPHCGAPIVKTGGCAKLFLILAILITPFWIVDLVKENKSTASSAPKTPKELRTEHINAGFRVWDGSHRALTEYIKNRMNDPQSYEHGETRYTDKGDYLIVTTTYRGKNGFGGVVKCWISAKCDLDGHVLEIIGQAP
jgi:hypothetical protein